MVEISKHLFDATCANVHCSVLTHPWHENCWKSLYTAYADSFTGSAKFYFIIHLIQNLIKGKKILNKKELMKAGEYYVRSAVMGGLICGSISPVVCVLRWIFGRRYNYYNFILIPSLLNGVFILLEPPQRRSLILNLFCSLLIEYWLRTIQRAGYISLTVTKQTLLFMIGSSLLFYLMRLEGDKEKRTSVLWLFTPEKVRRKTEDTEDVCPHKEPCLKYILKGTLTYFGIGFGINMARLVIPKITRPWKVLSSIRSHHLNLSLFFGTYIGIYRAVICYLCRKQGYDAAEYALPAGFLAGLSFLFKPSLGFAIASLTGAFKLYSTILYDKKILTDRVPLPLISYCLCQGILFHARMMHADVCPQYMFKLMSGVSNGRSEQVYANVTKLVTDELAKRSL